jgi:hypothetical protein
MLCASCWPTWSHLCTPCQVKQERQEQQPSLAVAHLVLVVCQARQPSESVNRCHLRCPHQAVLCVMC